MSVESFKYFFASVIFFLDVDRKKIHQKWKGRQKICDYESTHSSTEKEGATNIQKLNNQEEFKKPETKKRDKPQAERPLSTWCNEFKNKKFLYKVLTYSSKI